MRAAVLTDGVSSSLPMRRFEPAQTTPVEPHAAARKSPDPAPAFVEFENVQKTYDGEHLALVDLNLSIFQGEFLTLLGPSGSGKTTALMMLAGFEVPTAGEIRLRGKSLLRVPHYRRNIGVVFQNYALFPHMTVAENLSFPLSVRKTGQAELKDRVARALERLGMPSPQALAALCQQLEAINEHLKRIESPPAKKRAPRPRSVKR